MSDRKIAEIVTELFALLEPYSAEGRKRAVTAVFALFGEELPSAIGGASRDHFSEPGEPGEQSGRAYGPKAKAWIQQHGLGPHLDSVFYFHDGKVETHIDTMVGKSKREQTANCYLIAGIRGYLESDSSHFTDSEAIKLTKHTQCYDKNNHTTNRKSLGNKISGDKGSGFELTGPGLKAAAAIIVEISKKHTTEPSD